MRLIFSLLLSCALPLAGAAQTEPANESVRIERVLGGVDVPWALAFLPDGGFLLSERGGRLLLHKDGETREIGGVPEVRARGQGGLLDVAVARDFRRTREVFLSFAKARPQGGAGTALARAKLSEDESALTDVRVIFDMRGGGRGGRHFGSRIVEAPDGNLFLTIGDRGDPEKSQSLSHHHGKIIRVARDGAIPPDIHSRRRRCRKFGRSATAIRRARRWISPANC